MQEKISPDVHPDVKLVNVLPVQVVRTMVHDGILSNLGSDQRHRMWPLKNKLIRLFNFFYKVVLRFTEIFLESRRSFFKDSVKCQESFINWENNNFLQMIIPKDSKKTFKNSKEASRGHSKASQTSSSSPNP